MAASEEEEAEPEAYDPWEGYNRKVHAFNDFFVRYLVTPFAKGWAVIVPGFVRKGLTNFFTWAYTPGRLVNNLLQAKIHGAGKEVCAFLINGTVGMLGFWNAAHDVFALDTTNEDTNQTLGKWGIQEGPYFELPFIGPNTVRGTFGFVADIFMQPQAVIIPVYIRPETLWQRAAIIAGIYAFRAMNNTSHDPDAYENLVRDAVDPYSFIRDIYLQNMRKNVAD
ncbi:MAG: VacJ family lipoprotein [Turneriella sp.]|nr:VacJ family lipoprotein [Turneriella sp.]